MSFLENQQSPFLTNLKGGAKVWAFKHRAQKLSKDQPPTIQDLTSILGQSSLLAESRDKVDPAYSSQHPPQGGN
jgi:hypothetical protein